MSTVHITFRPEGREGVVAVGSYLIDAAKRFGVRFDDVCDQEQGIHFCSLVVSDGAENMSPLTTAEAEYFSTHERKTDERLACQTKIETTGDVVIMTPENKKSAGDEPKTEEQTEQFKKDFTEMPLEKKIASLVQLEAIALSETVSFVLNSPYLIFDKVMDVMAEFGLKKEEASKTSARPKEHKAASKKTKTETADAADKTEPETDPEPVASE